MSDLERYIERQLGEITAARVRLREALERVLKHAASEEFWQRQSVDHWDKPGPHNAAIKALAAINAAKAVLEDERNAT